MFVCQCRGVTDGTVRDSIAAGAGDICSLARQCGAGSRCGGCHFALRQLLAEAGLDGGQVGTMVAAPAPCHSQAA